MKENELTSKGSIAAMLTIGCKVKYICDGLYFEFYKGVFKTVYTDGKKITNIESHFGLDYREITVFIEYVQSLHEYIIEEKITLNGVDFKGSNNENKGEKK